MKKFTILTLLIAIVFCQAQTQTQQHTPFCIFPKLFGNRFCLSGDKMPFCLVPEWFPSTLPVDKQPIDLNKYKGTWYEIKRLPAPFQSQCSCSKAVYGLDPTGKFVTVDNSCITHKGDTQDAKGKAYPKNKDNTKLKVYFSPLFGGNYWVLKRDPEYKWVMVGEPCRKFLWILSREKTLSQTVVNDLTSYANSVGFDTSKFVSRGNC